ncbi:MAG TPA: c-type cytochrome [Steroidobacteraceae bacterium]|nr:c-type cytochrome [Steroidobacteraceae bacterium]
MSLHSRIEILLAMAVLLSGCTDQSQQRAAQGAQPATPTASAPDGAVIASALAPGLDHSVYTVDPRAKPYYDNPVAVAAGMRLFGQYNCSGCHSNGGGGMAPALMDDEWIYGDRLEQIHQTLVEGRPNGMPAWGNKIPDEQLWQLSAYVRSMSLPQTLAAQSGGTPSQTPAAVPASVDQDPGWSPTSVITNDYTHTPGAQ